MSTAQKILNLLNRESLSVSELAARLGVSRNSAYVQVTKLEAAGAVEKVQRETANRVGKPAFQYRAAPRHEDAYSSAYKPVLSSLVEALEAQLSKEQSAQLLSDAGRYLARAGGLTPTDDFDADLERALEAVNALGAMAERSSAEPATVSCHTCPIATLVHQEPAMCSMVASFFSEATATPVTVRCRHAETVVCGFSFGDSEAAEENSSS